MTSADIERFVDWGDHTTVVDPIRRDHWIYDGSERHSHSQKRGMREDVRAMERGHGWQEAHQNTPTLYLPTTHELDMLNKFTYRDCGNEAAARHGLQPPYKQTSESARNGGTGDGQLPVITGLFYSGATE